MLLFLDPGSGMAKNQDPGSGINIPDPQHWSPHLDGKEDCLSVGAEREAAGVAVHAGAGDGQQLQQHGQEADPLRAPTKHDLEHLPNRTC